MGEIVKIDRCFCHGKTLAALKQVADKNGSESIEDLQAEVEFGKGCELCHPYVKKMLGSGDTSFTTVLTQEKSR